MTAALQLVGVHNPVDLYPTFCIPVFAEGGPGANSYYVQVLGRNEVVRYFELTELGRAEIIAVDQQLTQQRRADGIFAFALNRTRVLVGHRWDVSRPLSRWLRTEASEHTFTALSVARFLQDRESELNFTRAIFRQLGGYDDEAAQRWLRDSSLRPAVVDAVYRLFRSEARQRRFQSRVEETWLELEDQRPVAFLHRQVFEAVFRERDGFDKLLSFADQLTSEFGLRRLRSRPALSSRRALRMLAVAADGSSMVSARELVGDTKDALRLGPLLKPFQAGGAAQPIARLLPVGPKVVWSGQLLLFTRLAHRDEPVILREALDKLFPRKDRRLTVVGLKPRVGSTASRNLFRLSYLKREFSEAGSVFVVPSARRSRYRSIRGRAVPVMSVLDKSFIRRQSRLGVALIGSCSADTNPLSLVRSAVEGMKNDSLFIRTCERIEVLCDVSNQDQDAIRVWLKDRAPKAKVEFVELELQRSALLLPTAIVIASGLKEFEDVEAELRELCIEELRDFGWRPEPHSREPDVDFVMRRGEAVVGFEIKLGPWSARDAGRARERNGSVDGTHFNNRVIIVTGVAPSGAVAKAFSHGATVVHLDDIGVFRSEFTAARWELMLRFGSRATEQTVGPIVNRIISEREDLREFLIDSHRLVSRGRDRLVIEARLSRGDGSSREEKLRIDIGPRGPVFTLSGRRLPS